MNTAYRPTNNRLQKCKRILPTDLQIIVKELKMFYYKRPSIPLPKRNCLISSKKCRDLHRTGAGHHGGATGWNGRQQPEGGTWREGRI